MATLKCSNCGYGIHYHDEPDGTQIIAFPEKVWDNLSESDLFISRYILDGTDDYLTIWKCHQCGSLHLFKTDETAVFKSFRNEENFIRKDGEKYYSFSDYDWEKITEDRIKWADYIKIRNHINPQCLIISPNHITFYSDNDLEKPIKSYSIL